MLAHVNLQTVSHRRVHLNRFSDYFPTGVIQIILPKALCHPDFLPSCKENVFSSSEATKVIQKTISKYTFSEVL